MSRIHRKISASFGLAVVVAIVCPGLGFLGQRRSDSCDLTGPWLATFEFAGRRPVRAAIIFEQTSAATDQPAGFGQWTRTGANSFSALFCLPGDTEEYRISGTLTLDSLRERLHGSVSGDVRDSRGNTVRLQGVVSAKRLSVQVDKGLHSNRRDPAGGARLDWRNYV